MDTRQAKPVNRVEGAGVNGREYTILDVRDESTCLTYQDGEWVTFYYERGQRTGESHFADINDACMELLRTLGNGSLRRQMHRSTPSQRPKRSSLAIIILHQQIAFRKQADGAMRHQR